MFGVPVIAEHGFKMAEGSVESDKDQQSKMIATSIICLGMAGSGKTTFIQVCFSPISNLSSTDFECG